MYVIIMVKKILTEKEWDSIFLLASNGLSRMRNNNPKTAKKYEELLDELDEKLDE